MTGFSVEISKRVLDAKLEACKFAFLKLSAVKTTRMKNYKQLRTLLMLKEISRRGADRDFLKVNVETKSSLHVSLSFSVYISLSRFAYHQSYVFLLQDPENSVTRILCSVLKQVVSAHL